MLQVAMLWDCAKKHHHGRGRWQRRLLPTQEAERVLRSLGQDKDVPPRYASSDLLPPVKSHLQKFLAPPKGDIQLRTDQKCIHWWSQSLRDSNLPKPHLWTCYTRDQAFGTWGFRGIILYPNYDRMEKGEAAGSSNISRNESQFRLIRS